MGSLIVFSDDNLTLVAESRSEQLWPILLGVLKQAVDQSRCKVLFQHPISKSEKLCIGLLWVLLLLGR